MDLVLFIMTDCYIMWSWDLDMNNQLHNDECQLAHMNGPAACDDHCYFGTDTEMLQSACVSLCWLHEAKG